MTGKFVINEGGWPLWRRLLAAFRKPTITVVQRSHDFMAFVNGDQARWGCGPDIDTAIGSMLRSQACSIGLEITIPALVEVEDPEVWQCVMCDARFTEDTVGHSSGHGNRPAGQPICADAFCGANVREIKKGENQ